MTLGQHPLEREGAEDSSDALLDEANQTLDIPHMFILARNVHHERELVLEGVKLPVQESGADVESTVSVETSHCR